MRPNKAKSSKTWEFKQKDIRMIPNLPNFNKTAAKTILPTVGASTWASGSQKCNRKQGSLTKKGTKKRRLIKLLKRKGEYLQSSVVFKRMKIGSPLIKE